MRKHDRGYQFPPILPRGRLGCIKGRRSGEFIPTSAYLLAEFASTSASSLALGPRAVWTNDHSGPWGPRAWVVSPAHDGEEIS